MGNRINSQIQALNELDTPTPSNAGALAAASSAMGKLNRSSAGLGGVSNEAAQGIVKGATDKAAKGILTASQQNAANAGQVNQLALGQQGATIQKTLQDREQALAKSQFDQQQRLSKLSSQLSKQLHDETMTFQKDELGRTVLNEQQILDYKIITAKNAEEMDNFRVMKEQILARKQAVMKQAYNVISQKLQQLTEQEMQQDQTQFTWEQQKANQELKTFLAEAKKRAQDKMDRARQESAKAAGWQGVIAAGIGVLAVANPVAGAVAATAYAGYQASK
jgi:hypothetical protein